MPEPPLARMPRTLKAGVAVLAVLLAVALLAPVLPPGHDPDVIDLDAVLSGPSAKHWLGTDGLGRDVASRVAHGARVSLAIGFLSAGIALLIGLPLGAVAGYAGGLADAALSRLIEAILCLPALVALLAAHSVAPLWFRALPDPVQIACIVGLFGWTRVARYLRAEFQRLRGTDVVRAARAAGAGHLRIAVGHIAPAAMAPVIVTAAFAVGSAVLLESTLSFLGLGVEIGTATWGGLLQEARTQGADAWWLVAWPGAALFLCILGCTWTGEGLRDLLDPRSRPA